MAIPGGYTATVFSQPVASSVRAFTSTVIKTSSLPCIAHDLPQAMIKTGHGSVHSTDLSRKPSATDRALLACAVSSKLMWAQVLPGCDVGHGFQRGCAIPPVAFLGSYCFGASSTGNSRARWVSICKVGKDGRPFIAHHEGRGPCQPKANIVSTYLVARRRVAIGVVRYRPARWHPAILLHSRSNRSFQNV